MKKKTNTKSKDILVSQKSCPVTKSMNVIGGKWKPIIIFLLINKINRFGEMQKSVVDISKQMLTKELRELEKDGIINRKVYPVVPPKVEYSLSEKGKKVLPVIKALVKFSESI
jgi:DNA-binding HxlR family transcriptional regulator